MHARNLKSTNAWDQVIQDTLKEGETEQMWGYIASQRLSKCQAEIILEELSENYSISVSAFEGFYP